MEKRKEYNWEMLASMILVIGTILGVTIPLHLGLREDIRAIHCEVGAIQQEMKDFHGRLCAIEERKR